MTVEVEADSSEQAEEIVRDKWSDSEYILDSDHFKEVAFETKSLQKSKDDVCEEIEKAEEKIKDYVINRANPEFWTVYDWFNDEFKKSNPLEYGLFDLNRYYKEAIIE